ncbi:hypothetical protein GCM10023075_33330 [Streptosporangium album]
MPEIGGNTAPGFEGVREASAADLAGDQEPEVGRPPGMVEDLVPDSPGERVVPLLPARRLRRHHYPGRNPPGDLPPSDPCFYLSRGYICPNRSRN